MGIGNWVEIAWCFIKQISLNVELNLKYSLFFFACPKKNQKRAPENDVQPVFWEEVRLGFGTTVVNSSGALMGSTSAKVSFK